MSGKKSDIKNLVGEGPHPGVAELTEKCRQLEDRFKRAMADLDNNRKRFRRELEKRSVEERAKAASTLLEVIDSLQRAISSLSVDGSGIEDGLKAILKQAFEGLAELGAEKIAAVGEPFDPALHSAVDVAFGEEDGIVVDELRSGYRIGSHLLRPAFVSVGRRISEGNNR